MRILLPLALVASMTYVAHAKELTPEEREKSAFHVLTGTLAAKIKDESRTNKKEAAAAEALKEGTRLQGMIKGIKGKLAKEKDAKKKLVLAVQLEDTTADLLEFEEEQKAKLECQKNLDFYSGNFTIDTAVQGKADSDTPEHLKALELVELKKGDVITLAFGEAPAGDCGLMKPIPAGKKIKVWVIPSKSGKLIVMPPNGWEEAP